MTIEEKLEHFYEVAVGEAKQDADRIIAEHQNALEIQLEDHKKTRERELQLQLKTEADNASREINKALSASQLEIKRKWTKKQNEFKEELFNEVKDLIDAFLSTPEYENYLIEKILESRDFALEDEITIYLTPEDGDKVPALTAKTGVPLEISQESFVGGIKAMIPHKNILIDHSFLEVFDNEKSAFTFDGGLIYE